MMQKKGNSNIVCPMKVNFLFSSLIFLFPLPLFPSSPSSLSSPSSSSSPSSHTLRSSWDLTYFCPLTDPDMAVAKQNMQDCILTFLITDLDTVTAVERKEEEEKKKKDAPLVFPKQDSNSFASYMSYIRVLVVT